MHACAVRLEVLKSWTLETDYSRAPCLGADQKTRGLWERDWANVHKTWPRFVTCSLKVSVAVEFSVLTDLIPDILNMNSQNLKTIWFIIKNIILILHVLHPEFLVTTFFLALWAVTIRPKNKQRNKSIDTVNKNK